MAPAVTGPVSREADGTLTVGGIRVTGSAPSVGELPRFARVSGRWNEREGVLETACVEPVGGFGEAVARVSVEGYVQDLPGGTLAIWGLRVDDSAWGRGLPGGDAPVRVEGALSEEGALIAERVWIRADGHRTGVPAASGTLPRQGGGAERVPKHLELPERPALSERPAPPERPSVPQRPDLSERARPPGPSGRPSRDSVERGRPGTGRADR